MRLNRSRHCSTTNVCGVPDRAQPRPDPPCEPSVACVLRRLLTTVDQKHQQPAPCRLTGTHLGANVAHAWRMGLRAREDRRPRQRQHQHEGHEGLRNIASDPECISGDQIGSR